MTGSTFSLRHPWTIRAARIVALVEAGVAGFFGVMLQIGDMTNYNVELLDFRVPLICGSALVLGIFALRLYHQTRTISLGTEVGSGLTALSLLLSRVGADHDVGVFFLGLGLGASAAAIAVIGLLFVASACR